MGRVHFEWNLQCTYDVKCLVWNYLVLSTRESEACSNLPFHFSTSLNLYMSGPKSCSRIRLASTFALVIWTGFHAPSLAHEQVLPGLDSTSLVPRLVMHELIIFGIAKKFWKYVPAMLKMWKKISCTLSIII
jgi:hypothetical protein